jgi:hypothetical protein
MCTNYRVSVTFGVCALHYVTVVVYDNFQCDESLACARKL